MFPEIVLKMFCNKMLQNCNKHRHELIFIKTEINSQISYSDLKNGAVCLPIDQISFRCGFGKIS